MGLIDVRFLLIDKQKVPVWPAVFSATLHEHNFYLMLKALGSDRVYAILPCLQVHSQN